MLRPYTGPPVLSLLLPPVTGLAGGPALHRHDGRRIVPRIVVPVELRVGLEVLQAVLDRGAEAPARVGRHLADLVEDRLGLLRMAGLELVVGPEGLVGLL